MALNMIKNKFLLLAFFTILLTGFVFSVPVVKINGQLLTYTNSASEFNVEVSNMGSDCNISDFIDITISSNATPGYTFPLYCNLSRNYSGYFSINFTANNPAVPNILVNSQDTVVLTYTGVSANLMVDTVNTVVGTFNLTSLETKVNDYYKGDANITGISSFSDAYSGLKSYYAYIVPFASLDAYRTNYTKRVIVDSNNTFINLGLLSGVNDGNYYVILDALDNAGNLGVEATAKNNKKILLVDNTSPQVTNFSLGSFSDNNTYYTPSTTKILTISLQDTGIGIRNESLFTQLDRNDVKLADYNSSFGGFYFDFNTVDYDINGSYKFAATDLLGNLNEKTFTIIIDSNAPTTPTVLTLTRAIDNNITIANWGNATDAQSGLKEYRVYRATSSFTTITNQTLVCTVAASATKSCVDTSSKSDNTTYHYGVSAVDNAGNLSLVTPASIKTGPSINIEIKTDYSNYVTKATPEITLEYGSDVNAVRFSCNVSTFTSWVEVSGTSTVYDAFNITSGNGCTTEQGEKRVYVEGRSEDEPFTIIRKSTTIRYDSQAPTIPTNIVATELSNGSIKLTWSASTDVNGSGLKEYKIYYSEYESVSETSLSFITSSTEYTFSPNENKKFYFKVSAIDKVLNQSALSSIASANARRFGPSFTFNVIPKNTVLDVIYLKKGVSSFSITSDQALKQNPIVRLKIGTGNFTTIMPLYNNLITTFTYDFQTRGDGTVEITGTNNNNETSTDTFTFVIDANIPTFDVNHTFFDEIKIHSFELTNFSSDIFRVQYLLNNNEEVCFIEDSNTNYECSLNTLNYLDGFYKMHVLSYDLALNYDTKIINFEIDNVDEALLLKENLIKEINSNRKIIEDRISFLESISINVSTDILDKFNLAKEKIAQASALEGNNFSEAVNTYTAASNLLLDILTTLPTETVLKTKTMVIDFTNHNYDLNKIVLDQNILSDNLLFFHINNSDLNLISVTRDFSVFEISGQNFYSSVLNFTNDTNQDKIISFIEVIPKDVAKHTDKIYFDREIIVIDPDPIVLYNIVIPKNFSVSTKYISLSPITSFDVLTKYDSIVYDTPLLLTGFVNKEDINFSKPRFDTKTLFLISVIFLVIIVLLLVIWLLASSRKKKDQAFEEFSAKPEINKYLGGNKDDKSTLENPKKEDSSKSEIEKKATYDSNYEFILDAVKRSNK